ncbi:MAG: PKD domain-containing protein [Candidatus Peribacteria bacterium]|jgi:PKD repeat protein|nr:PKD domain-containing protein [Candidatus Peribacteria bacterium]
MEQKILIQSIRREAIVDFVINRENNSYYVPLTVDFDASKSSVRDANIVKFTWDFGDGTMSE